MARTARSVSEARSSARLGWDRVACVRDGNTAVNALSCPALLVSGCASGQGKTTVTAALARYHSRAGCRVRVFKTGPDFIDPMVLEAASAAPVYNLDCWMVGIEASRALLAAAAAEADLILVEGAMGLYDGEPSTADLAATFGLPVVVVIDANAMAQTFGAVAKGLKEYRPVPFAGVIANRVAGSQHAHCGVDRIEHTIHIDLLQLVDQNHCRIAVGGEVARRDRHRETLVGAVARASASEHAR